jgi:hypothetical protein
MLIKTVVDLLRDFITLSTVGGGIFILKISINGVSHGEKNRPLSIVNVVL